MIKVLRHTDKMPEQKSNKKFTVPYYCYGYLFCISLNTLIAIVIQNF